jgi:hypothetical protein
MCFSIDLGSFVHPNRGSFSQLFITKTNLSKFLIPS